MKKLIPSIKDVEAFYTALIENSQELIAVTDANFNTIYRSPSADIVTGWTTEERTRVGGIEQTHPDDIEKLKTAMKKVAANPGTVIPVSFRTKHKAGHYIWLEGVITNLLHNKNVKSIVFNLKDVTERKTFEEKERLFGLIINSSDDAIISKDLAGIITSWNTGAEKHFGYSAHEIIGKHISTIIPSDLRAEEADIMAKIKSGEVIEHFETERLRKDGTAISVSLTISPIKDLTGAIIGASKISRVISELKKLEAREKKVSKEISDYKYALDESSILAITDQKGIIQHVNDNFCGISKYSRDELIGKDHRIINSGYHRPDFIRELWTTIANGKIWKGELKNKAKDGTIYWVNTTIVPFLDEKGKPYQYIAIRSDITKRKKAEEELVKTNRLYAFLSAINQGIVHEKDEQTLLSKALSIAIEIGKFESARIGMLDEKNRLVQINANDQHSVDSLRKYTGQDFSVPPLCNTPTGRALVTGKHFISNDSQNDIQLVPWKKEMFADKISSCASFPIKKFNRVVGVFTFLSEEKNFFDEKEVALLEEATNDISFALELFEKEQERELGKQKLENSRSNLQAVIENTDATIYSLDKNFRYIAFNHLLQESLRKAYNIEIEIGDEVFDFLENLEPEEAKKWKDIYSRALNGETIKFEREFRINDFHSFTSFSIHPIWESGNVIGLSCFVNDILQQKQDERLKAKMTSEILERNADLEQFSYIVSHNLRAPVANILGIADLIKNNYTIQNEDPQLQQHLFNAVDQLDIVIKDLNHILQVKHEVSERKNRVVFTELVVSIQSSIQNLIKKREVKIITDFSAVESMMTIRTYLQSIFYNLISNAIKYAKPDKSPVLQITSEISDGKISLKFKDNGMGIDLDRHAENIFGLYKRFHLDMEGKGVGLFMVKTQVETLGGKITVQSKVDEGTEFTIEFDSNDPT